VDTTFGFACPAESNAVEGEKRCRVVCVASCPNQCSLAPGHCPPARSGPSKSSGMASPRSSRPKRV